MCEVPEWFVQLHGIEVRWVDFDFTTTKAVNLIGIGESQLSHKFATSHSKELIEVHLLLKIVIHPLQYISVCALVGLTCVNEGPVEINK